MIYTQMHVTKELLYRLDHDLEENVSHPFEHPVTASSITNFEVTLEVTGDPASNQYSESPRPAASHTHTLF